MFDGNFPALLFSLEKTTQNKLLSNSKNHKKRKELGNFLRFFLLFFFFFFFIILWKVRFEVNLTYANHSPSIRNNNSWNRRKSFFRFRFRARFSRKIAIIFLIQIAEKQYALFLIENHIIILSAVGENSRVEGKQQEKQLQQTQQQ